MDLPKTIALRIGYDKKHGEDKSCLIVIQERNEKHLKIKNIFRGVEADNIMRKLLIGCACNLGDGAK